MKENKWNIILASHGKFAVGALEAVEMIVGRQEDVCALELKFGEGLEDFSKKYMDCLNDFCLEKTLILTDIDGGTPSNAAIQVIFKREHVRVFSGFNLPLLLEIFMNRKIEFNQIIDKIMNEWQLEIVDIKNKLNNYQHMEGDL